MTRVPPSLVNTAPPAPTVPLATCVLVRKAFMVSTARQSTTAVYPILVKTEGLASLAPLAIHVFALLATMVLIVKQSTTVVYPTLVKTVAHVPAILPPDSCVLACQDTTAHDARPSMTIA